MKKMTGELVFCAAVVVPLVLYIWYGAHHSGQVVAELMFGWIGFLWRVVPQLTVRWDGLVIFGIGLAGMVLLSHSLLRWLTSELRKGAEPPPPAWRFRSTVALVGLILVMFIAGVSMIGVVHQSAWLVQSDEPLFGEALGNPYGGAVRIDLKVLGLGVHNSIYSYDTLPTQWDREQPPQSWVTQILFDLNYTNEQIDMTRPWDDPVNAPAFRSVIPKLVNSELRTPPLRDERGYALNHFAGNSLILDQQQKLAIQDITDGTSHTLLIGEVNTGFVPWGQPENSRDPRHGINKSDGFGGAPSSGGATFLMVDGSIRFISEDVDPAVLNALSTPFSGD